MKLYDGRGQRFKNLIDPKVIMDENDLKLTEVLPKHARAKWYFLWCKGSVELVLCICTLGFLSELSHFMMYREHYLSFHVIAEAMPVLFGICFFGGVLQMLIDRRRVWRSKAIAIKTLPQEGFCPKCGYIIRATPTESDGCTPCAECGHAWRVELASS